MSRSDLLSDPWEISLHRKQLDSVIKHAPIQPLPWDEKTPESGDQRAQRLITEWRRQTFINCWNFSDHESHALWRVYCGRSEGLAVQTTIDRLRASIGIVQLAEVTYLPEGRKETPTRHGLATIKQPWYEYEQEVRLIHYEEGITPGSEIPGYGLEWDSERHVQSIRVHPESDHSFHEAVVSLVEQYAPGLKNQVMPSDMASRPPI